MSWFTHRYLGFHLDFLHVRTKPKMLLYECNFTTGVSYLFSGGVYIIIGLGNVLSPFGAKPLTNPMLTDGLIWNIKTTIIVYFLEN